MEKCGLINLIHRKQFGFWKNLSTTKAIATLLIDIYNSHIQNKFTKLCFIDLKNALDTVSHPILFNMLEFVGILGHELNWFKESLVQRFQKVTVNDGLSDEESMLGPLLFLLYINSMTDYIRCKILLFADDKEMYVSNLSEEKAVQLLQ